MTRPQELQVTFSGVTSATVASTAAVTSDLIDVRHLVDQNLAVYCKVTSASGTPDIQIEYKTAPNARFNRAGYWTENLIKPLVTPDGAAAVTAQIDDEVWHKVAFSIEGASQFIALVITGINANPADTVFQGYIEAD